MTTSNTTNTQIIVAFHIGRGGRFHNAGHKSFIGEKKISDFTSDLFDRFQNENEILDKIDSTRRPLLHEKIENLISEKNFDALAKFGITEEDLGEIEYYEGASGSIVGLTQTECESGVGRINIDNDYDTTYTCLIEDCNENELALIIENKNHCFTSNELDQWLIDNGHVEEVVEEEN
jgi:hypothetical protein